MDAKVVRDVVEEETPSRRHRPVSELRIQGSGLFPVAAPLPENDALRAALWQTIHTFVFETPDPATVARVWTAPPIGGDPRALPADVAVLLQGWFSLVELVHVYAFVETVHAALDEPAAQLRFAHGCNATLERHHAERRFVLGSFVPITSKADLATIERAFGALRHVPSRVEGHLRTSLHHLTSALDADPREAIHEAIRAAAEAGSAAIGDAHATLDETLERLEARGVIDKALKAAYAGLFGYAADRRRVAVDDARLVLVMCAAFVAHVSARVGGGGPASR